MATPGRGGACRRRPSLLRPATSLPRAPPCPGVAAPAPAPVAAPAVVVAPVVKAAPAVDLQALMLTIVAEKTGYPVEMLGVQMELEADLGIDSIKRVEILSAMRERAPGLPEVNASEMAALRTLGQIVEYMQSRQPAAPKAPSAAAPSVDLQALMLAIVAEKTGYPVEMLGVQMELEADLGIDSIKRVEILSAMRERAPGLPEVNASEMAALRTLGQIVEYMESRQPAAPKVAPLEAKAASAPAKASAVDLEALMLTIVAEKTGYPSEMLALTMELEADLGIDSIKRVEILSAMRSARRACPR
ncbi:MAG: hypothetical protein IPN17_23370 [Deltaproteobacteria bacterium]|nr:hypothetical protein [Deltaproteobacteria bacterium]